ncbi:MAG: acetate--CoA ligase family protein [Alphaproteobacteria bacterium]
MSHTKPKADLSALFAPKGVAFVGVSEDQTKYGGRMLRYCLDGGYAGGIYPVNPKYQTVMGLRCYPEAAAIDQPVDVVVALVGPERLPALYDAMTGRAKFIIVVGDIVPGGAPDKDARLMEFRRKIAAGGPRLIGPVCLGVVAPHAKLAMCGSSTLPGGLPRAGNVALASQSGGIVSGVIDRARLSGVGFSAMVSGGGDFDLDTCDYLEFFISDPKTKAIALYAEGLDEYDRFFALAEQARAADKPIVFMKPGFSEAGADAALSHTGRVAGDRAVQASAFRRHGVVLATDIDDLHATAALLAGKRFKPGTGVGAATLSGGYAVALGDALSDSGLPMAKLTDATKKRLTKEAGQPRPANPVDLAGRPSPGYELHDMIAGVEALDADPNVGAVYYGEMAFLGMHEAAKPLADFAKRASKPFVACWQGGPVVGEVHAGLRAGGVIAFDTPTTAIRALKALHEYGRIAEHLPPTVPARRHGPERLARFGAGLMPEAEAYALMADYGIPTAPHRLTKTPEEAAKAAEALGRPVALKGLIADVAHKTERGLVRLKLSSADVAEAAREMKSREPGIEGFLVQAMAEPGLEMLVGVTSDVHVGPAVVVGFGGIFAEAMGPPAVEVAPLDARLAEEMLARIDPKGILTGYRTGKRYDRKSLVSLLVALAHLAHEQRGRVREIDLNPVIVSETSVVAVDALVRLA